MYLILQARTDQSGWHELKCIYSISNLKYNDFFVANINNNFTNPTDIYRLGKKAKGIIIGGLGELGYSETDAAKKQQFLTIRQKMIPVIADLMRDERKRILGICFGHHLLGELLQAHVDHAPHQAETGIGTIELTEEGKRDPLFAQMPKTFSAVVGHKDAVLSVPENTTHLAYSKKCDIQAFRYKKHVYAVQFHPELSYDDLQYRLSLYPSYSNYKISDGVPSDLHATQILKNFINL